MRLLAELPLLCQKKAQLLGKTISSYDDISNIEIVQEALLEMTKLK